MFADVPRNGGMRVYKHLFLFFYELILISNFVSQANDGARKAVCIRAGFAQQDIRSLRDTIR